MEKPKFDHLSDREILILTCETAYTTAATVEKHGNRIERLEKWRNWMAGAGAVVGAFLGLKVHH